MSTIYKEVNKLVYRSMVTYEAIKRTYSEEEKRRLLDLVEELLKAGKMDTAADLELKYPISEWRAEERYFKQLEEWKRNTRRDEHGFLKLGAMMTRGPDGFFKDRWENE